MTSSYPARQFFKVTFTGDYVAHVEINRPDKMNAFGGVMWDEFSEIFQQLSTDPAVRAVVLSGAGDRAFTAGLDIKGGADVLTGSNSEEPGRKAIKLRRLIRNMQDSVSAVEKCEKPVICVLHGIAFGLAIDISTCADIRVCAADTKFAVKEVDIGIAADLGTLSRLPKVVGSSSWVKDIAYSARIFGAQEALEQGLVSKVYPTKAAAVQEALKLAQLIASKSPLAVQSTKALINYSVDHTVQEGLDFTQLWNAAAIQSADPGIAIQATISRKTPTFEKL